MRNGATCSNKLCLNTVLTHNTDSAPDGYDFSSRRSSAYWGMCAMRSFTVTTPTAMVFPIAGISGPLTGNSKKKLFVCDFRPVVKGRNSMFQFTPSQVALDPYFRHCYCCRTTVLVILTLASRFICHLISVVAPLLTELFRRRSRSGRRRLTILPCWWLQCRRLLQSTRRSQQLLRQWKWQREWFTHSNAQRSSAIRSRSEQV